MKKRETEPVLLSRPRWADAARMDRLSPDAPAMRRWEEMRALLGPLAALLGVEILLTDAQGICVGGTGPYLHVLGLRAPAADTALDYSLRTGQSTMVLAPGKESVCRHCSGKDSCADMANFTGPVMVDGGIAGVLQIVAFTEGQKARLLARAEKAFEIICQLAGMAWTRAAPSTTEIFMEEDARFPGLIGESEPMRRLRQDILKAAATAATVLVQGESGTGKELVARAIHGNSRFRRGPFVAVNCGAVPESLMESELFGYEAGAFSGASGSGRQGLLEQAHDGTFFLDEVSEMPQALQVKLLRVLQERTVRRVGGKAQRRLNIRIIAASNKDLRELVRQGRFREDLFFRLDVIPLHVPPLRERPGDARLLTTHFLQTFSREYGRTFRVSTALMRLFEAYGWPGNVRELKNFVEYGVGFSENGVLTPEVMAPRFPSPGGGEEGLSPLRPAKAGTPGGVLPPDTELQALLDIHGRHTAGKRAAARSLGVSLATLYRRLKRGGKADRAAS